MVNVCGAEGPPPGPGFMTVIESVPAVVRSVPGMTAVSWVALAKKVSIGVPLNSAVELGTKFVPVRVMSVPVPRPRPTSG